MILVDTSVWVDHLRVGDPGLPHACRLGKCWPTFRNWRTGAGRLRQREMVLGALTDRPSAVVASDAEILALIERQPLHGLGIGYVDAHLLAAVRLTVDARLWTRDARLRNAATRLGLVVLA